MHSRAPFDFQLKDTFIVCVLLLATLPAAAQFMFPGDTNRDGVANHIDLLPIGLAYGNVGPPRDGATTDWVGQENIPWLLQLPVSGVDLGFIDSDGNGVIDSLDIDAIPLNYDSTQNASVPPPAPYDLPEVLEVKDPPVLSLSFTESEVAPGDTAVLTIDYVYPLTMPPTAAVLATALSIELSSELATESQVFFAPAADAGDLMFVVAAAGYVEGFRSPDPGVVEFAASGRGQPALTSTRSLGKLHIIIEDMILQNQPTDTIFATITERLLINLGELRIESIVVGDTIVIRESVGTQDAVQRGPEVYIYPNPASENLTIRVVSAAGAQCRIFDAAGRQRKQVFTCPGECVVDTGGLQSGIYFLEVRTSEGMTIRRFVIH